MRYTQGWRWVVALFAVGLFGLAVSGDTAQVVIPGVGGLGYTCTDNPGEKKVCTCSGAADCWWMGRSGVCGKDVVLTCDNSTCSCDWVKGPGSGTAHPHILKDGGFLLQERSP